MSTLTQDTAEALGTNDGSTLSWYHYALMVIAPVAVLVYVWEEVLEDRFIARNFGVVEEGLIYRSGQISATLIEGVLVDHGIKVIIDLNGLDEGQTGEYQQAEIETAQHLGIDVQRFPLKGDGTGDIRCYADAIEVISKCVQDNKPVLVHCAAGAQRTGGVIASYRMLLQGKTPYEAVEELCQYESRRHKNETVVNYVNSQLPELAALLKERGVIASIPAELPVMKLH